MKTIFKASLIAAALVGVTACQQEEAKTAPVAKEVQLQTDEQKAAYSIGVSVATYITKSLEQQKELGLPADKSLVMQGFEDGLSGKALMDEEQVRLALTEFDKKINELRTAKAAEDAKKAIEVGQQYLAENGKKEGVTTTESGLQYEVLVAGEGASPKAEDTVKVHYRGTLIDGTEFDSSYQRNEPATFPLNRVISGWTEGVQLMKVGSKFKFTIPSNLAYGERDTGTIPANSTLLFEVELLDIEAVAEATAENAEKES